MRLSQPAAPFQGISPENVFFAADDRQVQLGMGFAVPFMQAEMYPARPLQVYVQIDAQPSARNLLLGALLGRTEQIRAAYPHLKGRIYAQLQPTDWEMLNFYSRGGFSNTDSEEEYLFPLQDLPPRAPMGCQFASVPLQTIQEQHAFITRLNAYRLTPVTHDYLILQMQQPCFMALGYYRGGQPLAEMMMTGSGPESIALVTIYVRAEYRRRGTAKSLLAAAAALVREQGAKQAVTHIYSRCEAQAGLLRSLGGTRRRTVAILPFLEITGGETA